ncbi:MAG: hypothetical protein BCS36_13795 [Desulfovibrio sp. MES5]|uniref:hypothetical protein n=1 Tax=Desulfovibrio sp. MES5 TaxID=1899016 RepID=UPI000B9CBDE5|nr:hypothetical protein [Desulfovibrio sp. MES5]OXS29118.1 MAG: hypothetical protein BCS36_13795 [Desulfovibrio sp. MES5]
MKTSRLASTTAALALVALLGTAGIASSAPAEVAAAPAAGQMGPHMGPHMNMTTEQMNALQDIHKEFGPKMQPLFQQKYGKQAEINALLYQGVKADDPRIVALQKDVKDVDNKLYQLDSSMRKQMQDKGVPYMGGHGGMGRGMMGGTGDCPGMGGRGMMGPRGGHGGPGNHGGYGMHGGPGMHGGYGMGMMDQSTGNAPDAKTN